MDERIRFVIRLKDGESMAALCREFQISRKTGYKIYERYEECGLEGLTDRARRPHRYANQLPDQIEAAIVAAEARETERGRPQDPGATPSTTAERSEGASPQHYSRHPRSSWTGHAPQEGDRAHAPRELLLSEGASPNALWCADYKGEFMLGDRRYCYPLTVTDHASRYLLLCEAMESNAEKTAFTAFERLFKERGLPQAIRSDNGDPLATPNGL